MDKKTKSTQVTIFGETYSIRSQADPEYTTRVAEHVNEVMLSIKKNAGLQDAHKIAILSAMSITDELFQLRESSETSKAEIERKCNSLIHLIETYLDRSKAAKILE